MPAVAVNRVYLPSLSASKRYSTTCAVQSLGLAVVIDLLKRLGCMLLQKRVLVAHAALPDHVCKTHCIPHRHALWLFDAPS